MSLSLFGDLNNGVVDIKLEGYLAKAKDNFPHVNQLVNPTGPSFEGTPDDFVEKYKENEGLKKRTKNKIKKCSNCGKVVAFSLANCNQCGKDLSDIEISYSNNVFTGFIYGIQKGPFPFTVSLRYQDPDYLVFDDLLSLCPCHLNVIPSTHILPDWRFLLKNPLEGRKIVDELWNRCWSVLKEQFLSNEEWKKKTFKGNPTEEELKLHVASGFNYPPSQFQLHLQYMLPPFIPFQYYNHIKGLHFSVGRFFPVEYVRAVLDLNEAYDVNEQTPINDIIQYYAKKGVDYFVIHQNCFHRYGESHKALANYSPNDFEGIVIGGKFYLNTKEGLVQDEKSDVGEINSQDKVILQNYGRPYKDGKPTGSYYKFAKKIHENLKVW